MSSFVFNSFKERFLNGEVPNSFSAVFLPMNNKFINNFSTGGFSIEQFRTTDDLEEYSKNHLDEQDRDYLLEDSKLKYIGIENRWRAITETEEQTKPMYVNSENRNAFTASEYWADCSANEHIESYINNGFYVLRTKEEFNWFANEVNEGNNGITGVLFDDVSYKISFTIGNDETVPFQGILDGNGHTLKDAFYVCTGSDNGLVSVLGAKGIVRNFILSNREFRQGTSPTLKGRKQINLNYLKNDARDVNAGLLVGRNYGIIENVKLSGTNDHSDFTFSFSGFVPQVYTVSNKSDDVSDFTTIRKKFDDGENFYFLNSWCINSPGNICPYVGYFAEGIFAQKAVGYDVTKAKPEVSCIDYAPKLKSYYDTGSEEIELDLSSSEDAPVLTLLAVFMKYDWCSDYLITHGISDDDSSNSLSYYIKRMDENPGHCIYYDNINFRKVKLNYFVDGASKTSGGMTDKEISILRSDPEWYSFNDDPYGRNAVAIVKCVYKNKTYFLELNGMYTSDGGGTETQTNSFTAGALDVSQLDPCVTEVAPTDGDKSNYCEIAFTNKKYYVSRGYAIQKNQLFKLQAGSLVGDDTKPLGVENASINEDTGTDIPIDISRSIRAFDENGNQIKINSCDGFSFVWRGTRSQGSSQFSDNANTFILTNVVFKTDIDLTITDTNVLKSLNGSKIRFASKLLNPYKLYGLTNYKTQFKDIKDLENLFEWPEGNTPSTYHAFFEDMYASDIKLMPQAFKYMRQSCPYKHIHTNDYKQFIASNFAAYTMYNKDDAKKLDYFSGLSWLFFMLNDAPQDDNCINYLQHTFEKVDESGKHSRISEHEFKYLGFRKAIYEELLRNLSRYLKHEVDYTNASYASQEKCFNLPLGGDGASGCISRHFIYSYDIQSDNNQNILIDYLKHRDYQYLMQENSNVEFYSKPIDFDNHKIVSLEDLYMDRRISNPPYADNDIVKQAGLITLETFNYNKFQYAPFISSSVVYDGTGNVKTTAFEAGAIYDKLIKDPSNKIHKDWVYRAANLYVKNPVYYGLDYNGHWTTMAVRTTNLADEKINQVNYNWNIMRAMYEGVPKDPDKPDDRLLWDGIYYDDKVFPDSGNPGIWNYYDWDDDGTKPDSYSTYDDEYSDASMIPNCMLNKPIRMHHMVRAAYNVAPIVGANYGTVSSISGNVFVYNPSYTNFVGFVGTVAGKNVNGTIKDIKLKIRYNLNEKSKNYVRYKNTPILPYSVTKNMNIPLDPESVDIGYYSVVPNDVYVDEKDKIWYKDILSDVNCITIYDRNEYKNNPNYIADKTYYNDVKYFSYFTSAWYDTSDYGARSTDDVISYQLKPIYVLGGVVGKIVASRALNNENNIKSSKIENVTLSIDDTNKPFEATNVDIHSTYGSIVGQVDIQTTDTDYNKDDKIVILQNISASDYKGTKLDNWPSIGYTEYQPIDMNTVVALSNRPRNKKNDYSGPYQHVLYAIDIPMNFDAGGDDEKYSYDKIEYANINQTSAAFVVGALNNGDVFRKFIECKNVYPDDTNKICYDPVNYNMSEFGPQSINSVLGSNTVFVPAVYPYIDISTDVYNCWKNAGIVSKQEVLYDPNNNNITRYYFRSISSFNYNFQNNSNNAPQFTFKDYAFSNSKIEDKYFSYTYTTAKMDNETYYNFDNVSADMLNNIHVTFNSVTNYYNNITNNYYVADFSARDIEGDGINYSGKNYLVFGQSYSPMEIRRQINAAKDESKIFTSTLFSAYQFVLDDEGNPEYVENSTIEHKKIEATHDYQLGGFLVIEKPAGASKTSTAGNLVMFIDNTNNAEIDGRSYNLAFPKNVYTEQVHSNKGLIYEQDGSPRLYTSSYGGVLIHVKGRS